MKNSIAKIHMPMLLLGCFSMTQVNFIGSIGISEFFLIVAGPFFFISDYQLLKRDGFLPIVWLSISCLVGCLISGFVNQTPLLFFMRGLATPMVIFSSLVVGHRYLRRSPESLKWFFLGVAISWTINIFIFQRGVDSAIWAQGVKGLEATEGIISSPTFWISRIKVWMNVPIQFAYLKTPFLYSLLTPVFLFFFSVLTTESGRSAALGAIGAAAIVFFGGKKRAKMRRFSKMVVPFVLVSVLAINGLNYAYKQTAAAGLLGEKAQMKFERQMRGNLKASVLQTLMNGRMEVFVGAYAAFQRPILGYGPWALDVNGYYDEFISKYGDDEDWENYLKFKVAYEAAYGSYLAQIPAHSHIIGFWLWFGFPGLLFWLYVLGQSFRYFRKDLATIPQWFGIIAVAMPGFLWGIFFSPFGDRVPITITIAALMMTRAIRQGRVKLPLSMIAEMNAADRK